MVTEGLTGFVCIPLMIIAAMFILKRASDKRRHRSFFSFGEFNPVFYVLIASFLTLSFTSTLNFRPGFSSAAALSYSQLTDNRRFAQYAYELYMLKTPHKLTHHYRLLLEREKAIQGGQPAELFNFFDSNIQAERFYQTLRTSANRQLRDAGHLALAILVAHEDKTAAADYLNAIHDPAAACVQLTRALTEEHAEEKITCLEKEILNNGNVTDAIPLLADAYYNACQTEKLYKLAADKQTAAYVPAFYHTFVALQKFDAVRRIPVLLKHYFQKKNLLPIVIAFFVFSCFLFLLHYTSTISLPTMLLCGGGSVLFFLLATPLLYDLLHRKMQFRQNGEALNDFAYFTAGIALTEELLKAIPFLLSAMLFSRKKDPSTYFGFALLSGAAFAFSEIVMHTDGNAMVSVAANAFWLSLIHIISCSITAYLLIIARFKMRGNDYIWLLPAISVGAVLHGVYDYCMATENMVVSLLILITGIGASGIILNNVLSNSSYSVTFSRLNYSKIIAAFSSMLVLVLLAEYGHQYSARGVFAANYIFSDALKTLSVPAAFFTIRLAQTDVFPGKWQQLQLFSALNPFPFLFRKHIDFSSYVGRKIKINGARKNKQLLEQLPATGIIKERELISGYAGWFVAELDKPLVVNKQTHRQVLFRTIEKNSAIEPNRNTGAAIYILPDTTDKADTTQEDLIFLDWVLIN